MMMKRHPDFTFFPDSLGKRFGRTHLPFPQSIPGTAKDTEHTGAEVYRELLSLDPSQSGEAQ